MGKPSMLNHTSLLSNPNPGHGAALRRALPLLEASSVLQLLALAIV